MCKKWRTSTLGRHEMRHWRRLGRKTGGMVIQKMDAAAKLSNVNRVQKSIVTQSGKQWFMPIN
jgi:hypothetical protein